MLDRGEERLSLLRRVHRQPTPRRAGTYIGKEAGWVFVEVQEGGRFAIEYPALTLCQHVERADLRKQPFECVQRDG